MIKQHKLWTFHGGLHLLGHKEESTNIAIQEAKLPTRLSLPLQQYIGKKAKASVNIGDQILKGEVIAKPIGYLSTQIHAPTSGTVISIQKEAVPHPSGLTDTCIIIESDGKDKWETLPPPIIDYRNHKPEEIIERVTESGIVGLGGAIFPSGIKLSSNRINTLIINGAECEPYITCDDMLMREKAFHIARGIDIISHTLAVSRCIIGIEDNKRKAFTVMQDAIAKLDIKAEVVAIPTIYPSGSERQLIYILTGKEVPSSSIPAEINIICHNISTVHAIADAVLKGRPLISRIITITGTGIHCAQNFHALIGTPIENLVQEAGGYTSKINQLKLICGGPMMGFSLKHDKIPLTKGFNCLLILKKKETLNREITTTCIRCGKCIAVCPIRLLPQKLYKYSWIKDFDKVRDLHLFDCIECGCCSYVCPSNIPLVQYYRFAKAAIVHQEKEKDKAKHTRKRYEARVKRLKQAEQNRKSRFHKKRNNFNLNSSKSLAIKAAIQRINLKKKREAIIKAKKTSRDE